MKNLLDPSILFFVFGVLAGALRSNLEIPRSVAKFLSLYLLMALGLKGGFALAQSGFTFSVATSAGAAIALAILIPAVGYAILRRRASPYDAAAVAASYGSVSAVTFVTAMQHLESSGQQFGGHMLVAMVLMESPAIIMAVLFARSLRQAVAPAAGPRPGPWSAAGKLLHESFTDGAQLLLLSSMAVGFLTGETGQAVLQPFAGDLFKGLLCFFLLDMGLLVARNFQDARRASPALLGYAVVAPGVHACIALGMAWSLSMNAADATLLMVLAASASYIVVPAVLRYAIPEANPAIYLGLSLGVTFPLNILAGIPAYGAMARALLG